MEPDEIIPPQEDDEKILTKAQIRTAKRMRKARLKKLMGRVATRKKKTKTKHKAIISCESIRTSYEHIFESYCKLLDMPYLVDQIFCMTCSNFYWYGDNPSLPKKCQVCQRSFYSAHNKLGTAFLSRPDIILDYNDPLTTQKYKMDTQHHRMNNLEEYSREYMKRVAIIRIDGGIHDKQRQRIKDWRQVQDFAAAGVKVFIVRNEDIDEMIGANDNGKTLLKFIHSIGEAVIDDSKYTTYTQDKNFQERVKRPF